MVLHIQTQNVQYNKKNYAGSHKQLITKTETKQIKIKSVPNNVQKIKKILKMAFSKHPKILSTIYIF